MCIYKKKKLNNKVKTASDKNQMKQIELHFNKRDVGPGLIENNQHKRQKQKDKVKKHILF